jgi:hypothetical protein
VSTVSDDNVTTLDRAVGRFVNGRHPVNIGNLVMGIAFLGLVVVWAIIQSDLVEGADVRWLLPVPWVFAGIAGLLATTLTGKKRYATNQSGWVDTRDDLRDGEGDGAI